MNDHHLIAPLIRGLCIEVSKRPQVIATAPAFSSETALHADLCTARKGEELDTSAAARILTEALAAWQFDHSPSGVEAMEKTGPNPLPSAIIVDFDGEQTAFFVGPDLDTARSRAEHRYDEPWIPERIVPHPQSACGRAAVVEGKIALVTGGAQGFGEEIVRGLASSGATVYIADLNIAGAEKLAAELNRQYGRTIAIPVTSNVSDEASVEAMFRTVAETTGGLDLCVSNAGVLKAGSVLDQDIGAFRFVTDVNYVGFFIITKHAGRLLRLQHETSPSWKTDIIQINSKSGLEGSNRNGAYAGGKFGGIGLVASFALELVAYGIKVNAICPGNFFDGPLWSDPEKGLFVQYLTTGKVPGAKTIADVKAFYEAKVPMKRGCEGPDVMRALYYIVEQEYETGQAVPVTGGQVMLH